MASKKTAETLPHCYTVSVVGLSGTEAIKGPIGVGKSCLCNRFVRPAADDFYDNHESFLSAADFNGQVVNNNHWLYWGQTGRIADDGTEYTFNVVEQTEFLDDTTFAPLRGGKNDNYLKRCSEVKLQSGEKLMYICRDQLGLEDEFEKRKFPHGKVAVDGFICVVDASRSQQRPLESQLEFVNKILINLTKTKKPVVVAATKMDEGSDAILMEIQRILAKKEFKGAISVVETSSLCNVSADVPFMLLASIIDKTRATKPKILAYTEADRFLQDKLDTARQAYGNVLNANIKDYRSSWPKCSRELEHHDDFNHYVELFGRMKAKSMFNNRVSHLRSEFVTKRKADYLTRIPGILDEFFPTVTSVAGRPWNICIRVILSRPDFNQRFVRTREKWLDDDEFLESGDQRLPLDLVASQEVEAIFTQHVNALIAEVKRQEYRRQFYELATVNKNVLPGAPLKEMEIFFMGRECYDKLSHHDRADVFQKVMIELRDRAKKEFLELLYERMDIFYKYDDPDTPITQEDVEALMSMLRSEPKCRALSRCEEDRKVIMLNHLGFLQYPIKEQCPFRTNCMEIALQKSLATKQKRSQTQGPVMNWSPNPEEKSINLIIIGSDGLANNLVDEIRYHYQDDEYHFDDKVYGMDYRTIDGDVSLPHNSLKTPEFIPHGCICVYSSVESLGFIHDTVNKTFLSASDERLQYQGLPIILMQAYDRNLSEKGILILQDEGRTLAHQLRCEFVGLPDMMDIDESLMAQSPFYETQVPRAMKEIAIQNNANNDTVDAAFDYKPPFGDIRLLMCHMCNDPYSVDTVLHPFLSMQSCNIVTNDRYHVIQFDTFISDVKRKVEVILASYHEATLLRDEFCHGYIMCYSVKRKASYSMIESFISKIPRVPSLVVAVNDTIQTDMSVNLTKKGNIMAGNNGLLFITTNDFHNQSPYRLLLQEVWDYHQRGAMSMSDSFMSSTLESSFNSSYQSGTYSPQEPNQQTATMRHSGRKQWNDSRGGLYLGGRLISCKTKCSLSRLALNQSLEAFPYPSEFENYPKPSKKHLLKRMSSNSLKLEMLDYYTTNQSHWFRPAKPANKRKSSNGNAWADNNEIYRDKIHAPLADRIEVLDYEEPPDALSDTSEEYALVHDALPDGKIQKVHSTLKREFKPAFPHTDSESDLSSLERNGMTRSPVMHRRGMSPLAAHRMTSPQMGRRALSPMSPRTDATNTPERKANSLPRIVLNRVNIESGYDSRTNTMRSDTPSEGSESAGDEVVKKSGNEVKRVRSLRALTRRKKIEGASGEEETTLLERFKNTVTTNDPEKQRKKSIRRKQKEEEKVLRDKQKYVRRKLKSRLKRQSYLSNRGNGMVLQDYVQAERQLVPKFVELCVKFLESEALLTEGVYRIPGNTAKVELLKEMFDHNKEDLDINSIDVGVNAVATALKGFFSDLSEPLIPSHLNDGLVVADSIPEKTARLLALRGELKKLPSANYEVLRYLVTHLYKITKHSDMNKMDSKNLAICWWPTIIRPALTNIEEMRKVTEAMQEITMTMIEQHGFFFYNEHEV